MLYVCGDLPGLAGTTGTESQRQRDYDIGSCAKILITAELDRPSGVDYE